MLHRPVALLYVPAEGVADTNASRPIGSTSVTTTSWARLGPWLVAEIVNVTLLPTTGELLSTTLVTPTSVNTLI